MSSRASPPRLKISAILIRGLIVGPAVSSWLTADLSRQVWFGVLWGGGVPAPYNKGSAEAGPRPRAGERLYGARCWVRPSTRARTTSASAAASTARPTKASRTASSLPTRATVAWAVAARRVIR